MLATVVLAASVQAVPIGEWTGYMHRGDSTLHVTFDFISSRSGLFSSSDLGAIDIPLQGVRLGRAVHWNLVGDTTTTVFDGTVNDDDMTGVFRDLQGPGTFALHRTSASTEKPYTQTNVTFRNGSVILSGTVYAPRTQGARPAVIFVQGSGSEGRWASAYLADYVARRGIVALIYDKRGVGASTGDWRTAAIEELVGDGRAGVDLLGQRSDVNRRSIGVYGHSQGGGLAPAIAAHNPKVSWIIAADGPVGPQYQQDLYRVDTMLATHYSGDELREAERVYADFVNAARSGAPTPTLEADLERDRNAPWLSDLDLPPERSWIWSWYKKTSNYDNRSAWASVSVPVLLIFGSNDEVVPPEQSLEQTQLILATHGNRNVAVHVFQGADHTLHLPPASSTGWPTLPAGFPSIITTFIQSKSM